MILKGKARKDFAEWEYTTKRSLSNSFLDDTCYNALIIEWLDSVGIYVGVTPDVDGMHSDFTAVVNTSFVGFYPTRQQATEKAIERAVELFNGK